MAGARKLLVGAAWMYGAQLATVITQFGYAAVTSRLVGPSTFGAYAIALAVSGLVALLLSGGVTQSVARMKELEISRLRGLVTFALAIGICGSLFIWMTASIWAAVWGDNDATPVIQFLALNALIAPLTSVATTVLRRQGSFRRLALGTFISNVLGMGIGLAACLLYRSATALAVSAVAAQLLLLMASLFSCQRVLWGLASVRRARAEIVFSSNLTGIKLAEYLVGNMLRFGVSRWLGSSYFGHWNRADTLATLPFQQVQNALLQAVSPEFRHDIDNPGRAHRVWSDLLTLVAWFALPASAAAAVLLPVIVPLMFGPGWEIAAMISAPLALSAGLQTVSTVLSSAVESLGRFKWMWVTSGALIMVQLAGLLVLFYYRDLVVAMLFLILTQLTRHIVQLYQCHRWGYVDVKRLLFSYFGVGMFSLCTAAFVYFVLWLLYAAQGRILFYAAPMAVALAVLAVGWRLRAKLPPVILARRYGVIA